MTIWKFAEAELPLKVIWRAKVPKLVMVLLFLLRRLPAGKCPGLCNLGFAQSH